ncbi:6-phosphogluconolactonase [Marinobacter salinexigens]|uniref:6-phosphogluconolactonase n=1 Tax=Marinobacter salinexigens TaxID=2919747 RepID=A0A5B0VJL9_9GAMM|nr:6-phosphogluconolactonase [Marinobacter salinexigens]KAA1174910.1 6-phosphogluconolactonase [Marinobacter salinexigens]
MSDLTLPDGVIAHLGSSAEPVAQSLADEVANVLSERLSSAPRASLAVSGGSTPVPFFRALSDKNLDWCRVDIVLVDERWVDENDPASNTRLVKDNLLQGPCAQARFFSLKQPGESPAAALSEVEKVLDGLWFPLDVLILGMGTDGHTASLFPDAPELPEALALGGSARVAAMTPISQPQQRITLTFPVLAAAGYTALHLRGDDKLETLARALAHPNQIEAMPVRGFLKPGLRLFWSP